MTDDLIEVYKNSKKLMPLVHLPVQSGSNKILDLMNRKHTLVIIIKYTINLKKLTLILSFQVILLLAILVKRRKILKIHFS